MRVGPKAIQSFLARQRHLETTRDHLTHYRVVAAGGIGEGGWPDASNAREVIGATLDFRREPIAVKCRQVSMSAAMRPELHSLTCPVADLVGVQQTVSARPSVGGPKVAAPDMTCNDEDSGTEAVAAQDRQSM